MEILGIDIGGSGIKGTIINTVTGELLFERHRIETPEFSTPAAVGGAVDVLVKHFGYSGPLGCGFPAAIQHGIVKTASNIDKSWIGTNAGELFTRTTGCPAYVLNDADAAGMAEMQFGSGKDFNGVAILVTVGTGIGTVIFNNGQLLPNTELGHLTLHEMAAEKYTSDAVRKNKDMKWKEWAGRFNEYLQLLYKYFYPDMIVIGGGASKKYDKFYKYLDVPCKIVPAVLRNEAGLIGAALFAEQNSKE